MREMKDSGIEWIGAIPVEWTISRVKGLFYEVNDRSQETDSYQLLSVSEYYGVAPRSERIEEGEFITRAESLDGYKICKPGDIVMNIMLAWKRALGVSNYQGIISPAYCVYRKKRDDILPDYYHYLFRTDVYANLFKQFSTGIIDSRLRLYPDKFLSLKCQVPAVQEQIRIVSYLDSKCSKIDKIIEKQQAIIEKLKEYKLSVITEAVTGGSYRGERVSSGMRYVETIPAHWENRKMISILSMRVVDGPHESPELYDEGIPYVSATAIENGKIDFTKIRGYISQEYCDICDRRYKPQRDDILVIKLGASTGQVAMVETDERFNVWVPLAAVRCNEETYPRFVYYAFQSDYFIKQMELSWTYGTQQTLGVKTIERLRIFLPPYEEQKLIANEIDKKYESINKGIEDASKLIGKLEEYKKSLIYEIVTGKKEV